MAARTVPTPDARNAGLLVLCTPHKRALKKKRHKKRGRRFSYTATQLSTTLRAALRVPCQWQPMSSTRTNRQDPTDTRFRHTQCCLGLQPCSARRNIGHPYALHLEAQTPGHFAGTPTGSSALPALRGIPQAQLAPLLTKRKPNTFNK